MSWRRYKEDAFLNYKLDQIKEGEHWNKDLTSAVKEKMLFRNPDREEKNTEYSRAALKGLSLGYSTRRDAAIDYNNPREELPKFAKFVDQIPPFDQGTVDMSRPYDFEAHQQKNQVIQGRTSYVLEEGLYDVTLENQKEKADAMRNQQMRTGTTGGMPDPGVTPSMEAELRRASLQETVSAL